MLAVGQSDVDELYTSSPLLLQHSFSYSQTLANMFFARGQARAVFMLMAFPFWIYYYFFHFFSFPALFQNFSFFFLYTIHFHLNGTPVQGTRDSSIKKLNRKNKEGTTYLVRYIGVH